MSDSKEYILRKPMKAFPEGDEQEPSMSIVADDGLAYQFMDKEGFFELFVEFDVELLKQKIRAEYRKALERDRRAQIIGTKRAIERQLIDAVLSLCFGEETNK